MTNRPGNPGAVGERVGRLPGGAAGPIGHDNFGCNPTKNHGETVRRMLPVQKKAT